MKCHVTGANGFGGTIVHPKRGRLPRPPHRPLPPRAGASGPSTGAAPMCSRAIFGVVQREGMEKGFWTRIGTAFQNQDGS